MREPPTIDGSIKNYLYLDKNGTLRWLTAQGSRKKDRETGQTGTVKVEGVIYSTFRVKYYLEHGFNYRKPPTLRHERIYTRKVPGHAHIYKLENSDAYKVVCSGEKYVGVFPSLKEAVTARDLFLDGRPEEITRKTKGVSFNRSQGKWEASLIRDKVRYFLGRFTEEEDARKARADAESFTVERLEKFRVTRRPKRYCQRSRTDFCSHLSETGCELYGEFRDPYDYLVLRRCLPNCKCPYNIEK